MLHQNIINYNNPFLHNYCLDGVRDSGELLGREGNCPECEAEQEVRASGGDEDDDVD